MTRVAMIRPDERAITGLLPKIVDRIVLAHNSLSSGLINRSI